MSPPARHPVVEGLGSALFDGFGHAQTLSYIENAFLLGNSEENAFLLGLSVPPSVGFCSPQTRLCMPNGSGASCRMIELFSKCLPIVANSFQLFGRVANDPQVPKLPVLSQSGRTM